MANSLAAWRNMLNQRMLTTGQRPTPEELQALRMAELEASYNAKAQQRAYAIQEQSLRQQAEQERARNALTQQGLTNQYNLGQESLANQMSLGMANINQAKDAAAQQKQAALISAGIQAPMTGMSMYGLYKQMFPKTATSASSIPSTASVISTDYGQIPSLATSVPTAPNLDYATPIYQGIGGTAPSGVATGTTTSPFTQIPVYQNVPQSATTLPLDVANAYEGAVAPTEALAGTGEIPGAIAGTATGATTAVETGALVPQALGEGWYTGMGEAAAQGAGSTTTGGVGSALSTAGSMIPSWVPYVGWAMAARDLIDPLMPTSMQGGWQGDFERAGELLGDTFDSHGNLISSVLYGGGAALGTENAFKDVGTSITDALGENLSQALDPIGAVATGADVEDVAKSVLDPFGLTDDCIICTACHGRDSEEVDVTRRFRDRFMDPESIRGYYMIAEPVVKTMKADSALTERIKHDLVDRLIDYGRFKLGETDSCAAESERMSTDFLTICKEMGSTVDSYVRTNGERV